MVSGNPDTIGVRLLVELGDEDGLAENMSFHRVEECGARIGRVL